jgi:hypothetical protein
MIKKWFIFLKDKKYKNRVNRGPNFVDRREGNKINKCKNEHNIFER